MAVFHFRGLLVSPILAALLAIVIPPLAGFIAKEIALANAAIGEYVKSPFVQALIGVVVGYLTSLLSGVVGFSLPGSLAGFDQNVIAAVLTALVALLTHTSSTLAVRRLRR